MSLPVDILSDVVLPSPVGYKILIAIPKMDEKIGSIITPEKWRNQEESASIVGCVISIGPDAYLDTDKYPNGPWCQVGDWVLFRAYSGTRLKVEGQEYRLINDDTVEGTVDDPRKVNRSY